MSAIITNQFRVHNAVQFANPSQTDSYYIFIGRPQQWVNEYSPAAPIDSVDNSMLINDDIISLKRIVSTNMSTVIKKLMWQSGGFYDIYRHDYGQTGVTGVSLTGVTTQPQTLADANYFVITNNYKVFVCISNGNTAAYIDPSSVVPNSHKIVVCSDGYIWKYIGKASTSDIIKFATSDYQPVKTITSAPSVGDEYEEQWQCQLASKDDAGAIFNIVIDSAGSGYGNNLTNVSNIIRITGDGTGCAATVNTNGAGAISKINITNYGTGYTWANVTFTNGTGAVATAIITPQQGLGTQPVLDLNAYSVSVNARFEYDEGAGDFTVLNDFRRIGMVINPTNYSSSVVSTASTLDATTHLIIDAGWTGVWYGDIIIEDAVTHARGYVVDAVDGIGVNSGKKILRIIRTRTENSATGANGSAEFISGHTVSQVGGGASGIINLVENSDIEPGSGKLIYIENRRPIVRSSDQIEDIKLVFQF